MNGKFSKDVKLKNGTIVPRGTMANLKPFEKNGISYCEVTCDNGTIFKTKTLSAVVLIGKKVPTISKLEKWCEDGICKTPAGKTVEVDGEDYKGFPSWARLLGLV